MRQGLADETFHVPPPRPARRVLNGLIRRAQRLLLPSGRRVRRVPFGITRGLRIENDLHSNAYLWLGLYEWEIHRHVRRMARSSRLAYDIGAASGVQALALAKLTGRPVYAFERDEESLHSLAKHDRANPGQTLVPVGAWVGATTSDDMVTLDDFVLEEGRTQPDFVLIDVEGAELDVLSGGKRLLRTRRPHLIVEVHSAALERECAEVLRDLGYEPSVVKQRRWLREDRPNPHNRWLVAYGRDGVPASRRAASAMIGRTKAETPSYQRRVGKRPSTSAAWTRTMYQNCPTFEG
jgi:hypothetical protein